MLGARAPHQHASFGDGGGAKQRSGLHPVRNGPVDGPVQALHTHDADGARAGARDARAHLVQAVGQIHDFRLLGRVFQRGTAAGQTCGHHQVFRRADAGQIQVDARSGQPAAELAHAAERMHLRAQRLQTLQMQIDGPLTDGAAARQAHARAARAGQNGPQNQNAGAKLSHALLI